MKNIYLQLPPRLSSVSGLVLATVTRTAGSTPQKSGSSALFNNGGLIYGTVGGGIVEARISKEASTASISGVSGHFHFNLANDISNREEAICGGRISVLLDADIEKNREVFEKAAGALESNRHGILVTGLKSDSGDRLEIDRFWIDESSKPGLPPLIHDVVLTEAKEMLSLVNGGAFRGINEEKLKDTGFTNIFLEPVFPAPKLVIAGAGHIGKVMSHLGGILGFEVTVIDDRPDLACSDNLPDANRIVVGDIGQEMQKIHKDSNTYALIVTRGHKDDAEALKACIGSGMAYTGMIGSRKKVNAMRDSFLDNGWATQEQWDAVYAPVGLEIGSQTVEEIAFSIAAQIISVKNNNN